MKILYLFRDCYESQLILSRLNQKDLVVSIILETGKDAKIRKFKRYFRSNLLKYPFILLDIFSLIIYSNWVGKNLVKRLGKSVYPINKINLVVDDANEKKCLEFIQKNRPNLIFVYGTAILSKGFLKNTKATVLNIHEGILPFYRNVHSEFWTYINGDYKNAGVCIFHVDPGIDSGDIAIQRFTKFTRRDSFIYLKIKNLKLIPVLIEQSIDQFINKKLKKIKQKTDKIGVHPTPKFKDLLRFYLRLR